MTLQEFLSTASQDHVEALAQAKAFSIGEGVLLPATTVNQMFAQLDLTGVIKDIAEDVTHPARHKLASVLLSIQGNHEFNFIQGTVAGDGNLQMLDWLIVVAMTEYAPQLTALRQTLVALSNKQTYPFNNTTLHEVMVARSSCPKRSIMSTGRFVVITTTNECEKHNPRLLAFNSRLSIWQPVNTFYNVGEVGVYEAEIPSKWFGAGLSVDNAYGVIQ